MKKNLIYGALALAVSSLYGCKEDSLGRYDNSWLLDNDEKMTLESSATSVKLNVDELGETALTFKWTPAREMSDEYILSYVTMLDLKTNQFNASSVERTLEDDGVFEKSYTNEELQKLIVEKWGKPISEVTTLSFKVIAKWEGGDRYVMPETRTVDVDVQPYRPITFDADKVFLDGEAVKGVRPSGNYTMTKTPENEFVYAGEFEMVAGRLLIPIEYEGVTRYICPADRVTVEVPDADQVDGKPAGTEEYAATVVDLKEGETEADLPAWNLPSAGYWRVIIDMENKTVKFFSPKNRLKPFSVEFYPENNNNNHNTLLRKTFVTGNLYGWGAYNGWGATGYMFEASQIDPQLLVHRGNISIGGTKFFKLASGNSKEGYEIVNLGEYDLSKTNNSWISQTYSICPTVKNEPLKMNDWMPIKMAVSNDGWVPETTVKVSKITLDIRNMRIRFD